MPGAALGTLNQVGFQALAVTSTPVGLTRPTGERPRHALIGVSGGAIRWLAIPDQSPTPTYGSYVGAGGTIDWTSSINDYAGLIDQVKFVAVSGTPNLEVSYFG